MEFDEQKSSCWTFPDCLERKIDSLGFYFLKKKREDRIVQIVYDFFWT